jgi:CDP-glucose 4,6-dehydratase
LETFSTNALGTANVLEAARHTPSVKGVVCVTTDKVYKNLEWSWPYRESDRLGGKDPYSASKAAAELIIDSYAASFPYKEGAGPAIATARGGNIIGGGDWSDDRLIPDFVRAVQHGSELTLRYPNATRPWQHVLGLVHGYILLLAGLLRDPDATARPWNLGPLELEQYSVGAVVDMLSSSWVRPRLRYLEASLPEAGALALDSTNAFNKLGWRPAWQTRESVSRAAEWYRGYYTDPTAARQLTVSQIQEWRSSVID